MDSVEDIVSQINSYDEAVAVTATTAKVVEEVEMPVVSYLKSLAQPTSEDEALDVFHKVQLLLAPWALEKLPVLQSKAVLCKLFAADVVQPAPSSAAAPAASAAPAAAEPTSSAPADLQTITEEVKKAATPFLKSITKCWTK